MRAEERLLLCMADSPEVLALFLGGLYIGAVPVPVSTMVTAKDLVTLATDSRAALIAVSPEFTGAAADAAGLPGVREVVVAGETEDLAPLLVPRRAQSGAQSGPGQDAARVPGRGRPGRPGRGPRRAAHAARQPGLLAVHLGHHRHAQGGHAPARLAAQHGGHLRVPGAGHQAR